MNIDFWTLGLQVINFLILVWVLRRFLYRPVLEAVARRQQALNKVLADAEQKTRAAEEMARKTAERKMQIEEERERLLRHEQALITEERRKVMREAHAMAEAEVASIREKIAREQREAEKALGDKMINLAVSIAHKMVAAIDGASVREAFLDRLVRHLGEIPPGRMALLHSELGPERKIQVTTSSELDAETMQRWNNRLAPYFEKNTGFTFIADKELGVGVELRFPHTRIGFSWRDLIALARKDLVQS